MKAKSIIVAIALATAGTGSAFASGSPYSVGEGPYPPDDLSATAAASPSKSRAQVRAETAAASRLGLLNFGEGDVPQATPEQERIIADAGRQAALTAGVDYLPDYTSVAAEAVPVKSRAQVRAETAAASRLGLLSFGEGDVPQATPEQERIIAEAGREVAFAEQREQGRTTLSAVR